MVVDAPHPDEGHTADRLRHMWGVGRVNVQWRPRGWFVEEATGYAGSYAKKLGEKRYQQEYGAIPPTVRTFGCSRLTTAAGRAMRSPGWAKMMARHAGYAITDARKRPDRRGWLLRLASEATGEVSWQRWKCHATLIRGPTQRPKAALLGPVEVLWRSDHVWKGRPTPVAIPSHSYGPIRLGPRTA
jgi:hypothetical protein